MIQKQFIIESMVILIVSFILISSPLNPLNTQGLQNYQPAQDYNSIHNHREVINESRLWNLILTENIEYRFEKGIRAEPFFLSAHSRGGGELWRLEFDSPYAPVGAINDDIIVMDLLFGYENEKFYLTRFSPDGLKSVFYLIDETWTEAENIFRRGRNFNFHIDRNVLNVVFLAISDDSGLEQLQIIQYDFDSSTQNLHRSLNVNCESMQEVIFAARELKIYCKNREGNQLEFRQITFSRIGFNPIRDSIILTYEDSENFALSADSSGYLIAETFFDPSISNYVTQFRENGHSIDFSWDLPYRLFVMKIWMIGNMRFAGGYFQSYVKNSPNPEYFAYLFAYPKGGSINDSFINVFPFSEFPYLQEFSPIPLYPVQLALSPKLDFSFIYSIRGWEPSVQLFHSIGVIIRYGGNEISPSIPLSNFIESSIINTIVITVVVFSIYHDIKQKLMIRSNRKYLQAETYPELETTAI